MNRIPDISFWHWVANLEAASDDPIGDFIEDTRLALRTGDGDPQPRMRNRGNEVVMECYRRLKEAYADPRARRKARTSREAARLAGEKTYDGMPCKHRHEPRRYTASGICVACAYANAEKHQQKKRAQAREQGSSV